MLSSWIPCEDLAIDLRVRLGDWFRVIQLAHGANEEPAKRQWGVGDVLQRAGGKEDETFLRKTLFCCWIKKSRKKDVDDVQGRLFQNRPVYFHLSSKTSES